VARRLTLGRNKTGRVTHLDGTRTPRSDRLDTEPAASRLALDHPRRGEILERHGAAMRAGRPTYVDPDTGYVVFTARYLADRGRCCESMCRHCPYVDDEPGAPRDDP
jgi:hypothetical protein